jgi:hypothetical protein
MSLYLGHFDNEKYYWTLYNFLEKQNKPKINYTHSQKIDQ